MSIQSRLNSAAKRLKKHARRRAGVYMKERPNLGRQGKQRGLDGTMFGPFRSRGAE